jgi:hypothetical protein
MGANPVPVPYPIVGVFSNVALVAQSVRMCGRPTFTTSSQVTRVQGDESGTLYGVKSGTNRSICESVTASTTVRAEGNYILRDGDVMKMNNGNTLGRVIYMPGVGPMILGNPSDPGFWERFGDAAWEDIQETWDAGGGLKGYLMDLYLPGMGQTYNRIKSVADDPVGALNDLTPIGMMYQSYKATMKYVDAYKKGGVAGVLGRGTVDAAKAGVQYATGEALEPTGAGPDAADTIKTDAAAPAEPDPGDTLKDPPADPKPGDTLKGVGPPAGPKPGDTLKGIGPPADPRPADTTPAGAPPAHPDAGNTIPDATPPAAEDPSAASTVRVTGPPPPLKFATAEEAAVHAMQSINPTSGLENVEYGGWVRRNPDGTYSYDPPVQGTIDRVPNMPDKGPDGVAWYHTHGADTRGYNNEYFSGADGDMGYSHQTGAVGYLATPKGNIVKYDPGTRTTTLLPQTAPQ